MFVTKERIKQTTGYEVDGTTLALAQMMIEAWVGKPEESVNDSGDRSILAKAVTFQAVYILGSNSDVLQQMAVKSISQGEAQYVVDTEKFSPYMSPWAVMTCKNLTWMGTRSVHTGPIWDKTAQVPWVKD